MKYIVTLGKRESNQRQYFNCDILTQNKSESNIREETFAFFPALIVIQFYPIWSPHTLRKWRM